MQLEWEFELKVKCLDIRSFKQHTCNDKHNKLLHANETYQLNICLVCRSNTNQPQVFLVYAVNGNKWRAEVPGHSKRRGRNLNEEAEG